MDEMKPGHRPDTIHIKNLPVKWFGGDRPRPNVIIQAFGVFGEIRRFYIPALDQLIDSSLSVSVAAKLRVN